MNVVALATLFILSCAGTALAGPEWNEFSANLERQRTPVFMSICSIAKSDVAVILFPLRSNEGKFYELQTRPDTAPNVLNFATLAFENGKLIDPDLAFGGEATLTHLRNLISRLLKSRFNLGTFDRSQIDNAAPCPAFRVE